MAKHSGTYVKLYSFILIFHFSRNGTLFTHTHCRVTNKQCVRHRPMMQTRSIHPGRPHDRWSACQAGKQEEALRLQMNWGCLRREIRWLLSDRDCSPWSKASGRDQVPISGANKCGHQRFWRMKPSLSSPALRATAILSLSTLHTSNTSIWAQLYLRERNGKQELSLPEPLWQYNHSG